MQKLTSAFCALSLLSSCSLAMDESAPNAMPSGSSSSSMSSSSSSPASSLIGTGSRSDSSALVTSLLRAAYLNSLLEPNANDRLKTVPNKRAYTYRSEFKRLPLYQFGIGKRSNNYQFGLGKRTKPSYSFGLGKRGRYEDIEELGYVPNELYNNYPSKDSLESLLQDKRSRSFNFGVGKRIQEPVKYLRFGLGKRYLYDDVYDYDDPSAFAEDEDDSPLQRA